MLLRVGSIFNRQLEGSGRSSELCMCEIVSQTFFQKGEILGHDHQVCRYVPTLERHLQQVGEEDG